MLDCQNYFSVIKSKLPFNFFRTFDYSLYLNFYILHKPSSSLTSEGGNESKDSLTTKFLLILISGLFLIEALSVIIQVASYKLWKKRVFKMAPIHHHFELLGWPEPKIVTRFYIIAILMMILSLATFKVR